MGKGQLVATCSLAGFTLGLGACWVAYHAPSWACGPFRADKAAEWAAVGVGTLAAGFTLLAVWAGLRSAERAIQNERSLRNEERDLAEAREKRQAHLIASVLSSDLYGLAAQARVWTALLGDLGHSLEGVYHQICRFNLPSFEIAMPQLSILPEALDVSLADTYMEFLRIKSMAEGNLAVINTWDGEAMRTGRDNLLEVVGPLCRTSMKSYVDATKAAGHTALVESIAADAATIVARQDKMKDPL